MTSHILKNSWHIAEYRLDIVWSTIDGDMLEWFFSHTVKCCLIFFTLFFMYQCIYYDVNKLWSLCQCLYIISTTLGSGVAHANLEESFANNQN